MKWENGFPKEPWYIHVVWFLSCVFMLFAEYTSEAKKYLQRELELGPYKCKKRT